MFFSGYEIINIYIYFPCALYVTFSLNFKQSWQASIDFDNLNLDEEIDFGEEINSNDGGDIDWGDESMEQPAIEEIDYNISLEESGIVVEEAGHEGGIAKEHEAYTILDNPKTRSEFINQLFEVKCINTLHVHKINCRFWITLNIKSTHTLNTKYIFLQLQAFMKLRLYELKNNDRRNYLSQIEQNAPPSLQLSTKDDILRTVDYIQTILSEILHSNVQNLHNIKHHARYGSD